jgi:hypothetical protein
MAIARRTASLREEAPRFPVDRADLEVGGVAGDEQPLSDLADREVRLQEGEQAKLRGAQGCTAGCSRRRAQGRGLAELVDLVDQGAEVGAVYQDVVDLLQQMPGGGRVAVGAVGLGQVQAGADGEDRHRECAGRTGPHRMRELAVGLCRIASVYGEQADGVVVIRCASTAASARSPCSAAVAQPPPSIANTASPTR